MKRKRQPITVSMQREMTREEKDHAMAEQIVAVCEQMQFPAGKVLGVAGNDLAHSKRLVALVETTAKARGVDISHVTLKPIATELITETKGRG